MVPLGALVRIRETFGPDRVDHYNSFPTADINGSLAPGVSSGQAVALMERLARETLPQGMGFEWTELTYQQVQAGSDRCSWSFRSPCCSPSWCWRRSTRAGRCRWW